MEVVRKEEHPYKKEYLERPLELAKLKLECLHKRMALLPEGKTDYEKNEAQLIKLSTSAEIKALTRNVAEREAYYLNYFNKVFLPDLEDLEENYGNVITEAKKRIEQNIIDLLAKVEFNGANGAVNIELKIHNFKLLKKLLAVPTEYKNTTSSPYKPL